MLQMTSLTLQIPKCGVMNEFERKTLSNAFSVCCCFSRSTSLVCSVLFWRSSNTLLWRVCDEVSLSLASSAIDVGLFFGLHEFQSFWTYLSCLQLLWSFFTFKQSVYKLLSKFIIPDWVLYLYIVIAGQNWFNISFNYFCSKHYAILDYAKINFHCD